MTDAARKSIVIPIVAGIGNALMVVPMVRRLKSAWPDAWITILARTAAMAEVFGRLEEVEDVVITGKGVGGVMRMVLSSLRRSPDVYLVPFPSNRWQYSLLAATSGAKQRVLHGYPVGFWRAMHFLPATRVPAVRGIHDVEQNLRLLTALGIETNESPQPPVFPLTNEDRACLAELTQRPIVVHAGSAQTVLARAKRWPTASYRELISALRREAGDRVVVVEGPDEAGVATEIVGSEGDARVVRLTGSLGEAAALLERAELYVGTDSGLAHLAAAVGTPAVTIFAPADPDRVCPYGYRDLVVQPPPPCEPCFLYPWQSAYPKLRSHDPSHRCIERVTVESVMSAVRHGLSRAKGDSHLYGKSLQRSEL